MRYIFSFLLLLSYGMAFSQSSIQSEFKIYDTRLKQVITIDKIISGCNDADVLFFGEEHNDSVCHYLEAEIFKALYRKYGDKIALSLEMFETDNQLPLNEYLEGFIPEDRFAKDVRLWSNYKDYRPMIEFAKENHITVIAADPPRRYVSMVSRLGMASLNNLSKEAKKLLPPLPFDTLSGRYREKFEEIMQGSPGGTNPKVYYSQNLWDAGMSYSIYKYWKKHKGNKIFHCVGGFHTAEKLGTAAQLKMRNKKIRILNIASVSDASYNNPDPKAFEKFSNLGDYILITNPDLKKTF